MDCNQSFPVAERIQKKFVSSFSNKKMFSGNKKSKLRHWDVASGQTVHTLQFVFIMKTMKKISHKMQVKWWDSRYEVALTAYP